MKAHEILEAGIGHMQERAATYDRPQGERSMGATVNAFYAVTGHALTEEQGWLFMALLKAVRSQQGAFRADSYEDGAAYFALAGEAAHADRLVAPQERDGWTSHAIRVAAFGKQSTIDCRTDEQKGFTDPRTVEGVDVSFPTEKHMSFAPEQCECHRCIEEKGLKVGPLPLSSVKMILCPTCGNKRCPKANDHRNECSGSNEPGQPGSAYR